MLLLQHMQCYSWQLHLLLPLLPAAAAAAAAAVAAAATAAPAAAAAATAMVPLNTYCSHNLCSSPSRHLPSG